LPVSPLDMATPPVDAAQRRQCHWLVCRLAVITVEELSGERDPDAIYVALLIRGVASSGA
jgi:hypothetical protein